MKTVVIGGGISGLTAAYELAKAESPCTLVEAQPRLGGVIRTDQVEGCLIEAGPDSFISQKPAAAALVREIGLGDELIGSNDSRRKTFVLRGGQLIPLPDGIQFMAPTKVMPVLTTPLFGAASKARMALDWFSRPRERAGDCSVADLVRDHYGQEAVEYLAQPMLAGVYGGAPEDLSAPSVLPRFVEIERKYGGLSRGLLAARKQAKGGPSGPLFQTLRGGLQTLVERLTERIRGGVETLHAEAVAVARRGDAWAVELTGGGAIEATSLVLAMPTHRAADLVAEADGELAEALRAIPYHSSVTAGIVYSRPEFGRPLDGFGFLAPRAEKRLLAACTWVNTKFDYRAPPDRPLLRAFLAGKNAERHMESADDEIVARMHRELREIMGFDADPVAARVNRWPRAMAQYEVGHAERVERIERLAALRAGLYLGGNGFRGIGIPDCIERSRGIVEQILGGR